MQSGECIYTICKFHDDDFIAIDNKGNFQANSKAIEKHLRVSKEHLTTRKLTPEEIEHFRKKDNFVT